MKERKNHETHKLLNGDKKEGEKPRRIRRHQRIDKEHATTVRGKKNAQRE